MSLQPKQMPHAPPVASPDKTAQGKKAVKARLLLKLIKEGTIPRPPESFLKELQGIAGVKAGPESTDLKERVKNLAAQLQSLGAAKATPPQKEPAATSAASMAVDKTMHAKDAQQVSSMSELRDQHPAVIKQHLEQLDDDARANQLRELPGETVRQVSLLTWQRGKR